MKHQHDGRSYHDRIGRPFYGPDLKRVLSEEAVESWIERVVGWYFGHRWPAIVLLVFGCACLGAAVVAATWMLQ